MVTSEPRSSAPSLDFARAVQAVVGRAARLQRGVELVVAQQPACDHAAVLVATPRYVETGAASDATAARAEAWQHERSQGPGLDVVRHRRPVLSQELGSDPRWPWWAPKVAEECGFASAVSVPLRTDLVTVGALTLYADRAGVWDDAQVETAGLLAGYLTIAALDAAEIEHWMRAADSRTVIGRAEGLVMERFDLDVEQAFAYLRWISQTTHRKLVAVAEDLVRTRRLPPLPPSGL